MSRGQWLGKLGSLACERLYVLLGDGLVGCDFNTIYRQLRRPLAVRFSHRWRVRP